VLSMVYGSTGAPFRAVSSARSVICEYLFNADTLSAFTERIGMTETGIVKWFNEGKGFGFIAPDGGGKDLFAHFKEIQGDGFKTLTENQRVEFEVVQGQKGPQASKIRVVA